MYNQRGEEREREREREREKKKRNNFDDTRLAFKPRGPVDDQCECEKKKKKHVLRLCKCLQLSPVVVRCASTTCFMKQIREKSIVPTTKARTKQNVQNFILNRFRENCRRINARNTIPPAPKHAEV